MAGWEDKPLLIPNYLAKVPFSYHKGQPQWRREAMRDSIIYNWYYAAPRHIRINPTFDPRPARRGQWMVGHEIQKPPYNWPILSKRKNTSWEIHHEMASMLQAFINNHALNQNPNILTTVRNCRLLQFLIVSHPSGEDNT